MEALHCARVLDYFTLFASSIAAAQVFVFILNVPTNILDTVSPLNSAIVCMDYLRLC